MYYNKEK